MASQGKVNIKSIERRQMKSSDKKTRKEKEYHNLVEGN